MNVHDSFRRMENAFEKEYVNGDLTGEQVEFSNDYSC